MGATSREQHYVASSAPNDGLRLLLRGRRCCRDRGGALRTTAREQAYLAKRAGPARHGPACANRAWPGTARHGTFNSRAVPCRPTGAAPWPRHGLISKRAGPMARLARWAAHFQPAGLVFRPIGLYFRYIYIYINLKNI